MEQKRPRVTGIQPNLGVPRLAQTVQSATSSPLGSPLFPGLHIPGPVHEPPSAAGNHPTIT